MNAPRRIEIALSSSAREHLGKIASQRPYPIGRDYEAYLDWARTEVAPQLPANVRQLLGLMRDHPCPPGLVVVRNLPVDSALPNTPANGERSFSKETHVSEAVLAAAGSVLGGGFVGFAKEKQTLINDIVPLPGYEGQASNRGSSGFDLHTEQAFLDEPRRAKTLMLVGLRDDHDQAASTLVVDGRDVYQALPKVDRRLLRMHRFRFRAPVLHGDDRYGEPAAIFSGPDLCVTIRAVLYGEHTKATDRVAARALARFREVARSLAVPVRITPGTLLVADNRLTLHGRTPFVPRFDGYDRWIQRAILADLWHHREAVASDGRVIGRG